MFAFGDQKRARKPSLTPMIDVVFLLLVFFMLAARFGQDNGLTLQLGGGGTAAPAWSGAPRVVDIMPGTISLNGIAVSAADLARLLAPLMPAQTDPIILRARGGADVQRVIDVMEGLQTSGLNNLILLGEAE